MDPTLLNFYEQSPDWVKAVWVLSLPAFIVCMSWIAAHYTVAVLRLRRRETADARGCGPA